MINTRIRRFALAALLPLAFLAACGGGGEVAGPTPIEEEVFAPALEVDLSRMTRTESGLYLEDLNVGDGEVAEPGKRVWVAYAGWLVDGRQFDSNVGRSLFDFNLGAGDVIKGWDEGLQGMRVGGSRRLVIPSHLAYGKRKVGIIPAHATLVFEVLLARVE